MLAWVNPRLFYVRKWQGLTLPLVAAVAVTFAIPRAVF